MQESKWYCGVCDYEDTKYYGGMLKHMMSNNHHHPNPRKGSVALGSGELGEWCRTHGWRTMTNVNAKGSEDQCFILFSRPLTPIYPEYMGRAKNLIIIVTTIQDTLMGMGLL